MPTGAGEAAPGSGPSALKVAGNACTCAQEEGGNAALRVYGGSSFLNKTAPEAVSRKARQAFNQLGITILGGAVWSWWPPENPTWSENAVFPKTW